MQRITRLFFSFLLLLTFGLSIAHAQSSVDTTMALAARLRSGPGTEWRLLGNISAGAAFRLDGQAPGGGWVRGITSDGRVGWVVETAVAASTDQIATLPKVVTDTPFTLSAPPPAAGETGGAAASAPVATPEPVAAASSGGGAAPLSNGLPITTGNQVKLRQTPDTGATVITTLAAGISVSANGRNAVGDWTRLTLGDGTQGWAATRFLVISSADLVSLPVTDAPGTAAPPPPAAASAGTTATSVDSAPAVAVVNTAPVRGFNYGGHVQSLSSSTVDAMRRAGMTWVKRQWRYQAGQNPNDTAGIIAEAHNNGFRILIGIVGGAGDIAGGTGYFDQYAAFVAGAAAAGADAIEIWNEQNIDREWPSGSIDPALYTELLKRAYQAIKGANPNTLVISGALAPTGYFGGCSPAGCDDNVFVAGMKAAGAARYADCVGAHYNEGVLPPSATSGDPRGSSGYYTRYFYGMVNTYYKAFGKPICFTELGYLSPEGYGPLPGAFGWAENTSAAEQAQWLDQAVTLAARSGKVRLLIVWNVDYTGVYGDDPMGGYSIIRPGGGCPACDLLGS